MTTFKVPTAPRVDIAIRTVSIADLEALELPTLKIRSDEDVLTWKRTRGYEEYGKFLHRLNEAVRGHSLPWSNPEGSSRDVLKVVQLLDTLEGWIDPNVRDRVKEPARFGYVQFETEWGATLEERAGALLEELLSPRDGGTDLRLAVPYLQPYFITSFGSFKRKDYGTGHETSFVIFLFCLAKIGFFQLRPNEERDIVFTVFIRYLRLSWKLQADYRLEPAGSHGVWGLDDYHFLGYVFGSSQLRDQSAIPPSAVLKPPAPSTNDPSLPETNLYFMQINQIHKFKTGPFHEHSSTLYSIATGVQRWEKVNIGLLKMYEAEVIGKRVVVQHLPLGGLVEWDQTNDQVDDDASISTTTTPFRRSGSGVMTASAAGMSPRTQTQVASHTQLPPLRQYPPAGSTQTRSIPPSSSPTTSQAQNQNRVHGDLGLGGATAAPWASGRS
ncbi:Phosphotyrosyl phosphatase activator [Coniophora puteana RWD-64-598 SS2]|uniref:Serine/threonine-protein phosphatase 2A activator n=1 Tax=Coniophora puteana (strain RWD-64-598) TaxID=741705 RepID=A0A5M3MWZ6_CONPW|nr:Phosphotyrosyl phosphatase activator [Coniophora puteana RWD-64-598 SS2]EIW83646.1 Phosphotyrosyl phosphatase activator [Coniophora puteana RWD-64-598 SS2]